MLTFFNCTFSFISLFFLPSSSSQLTLSSALTLEFLEAEFYRTGFAKFPDADFIALGLSTTDLANLKAIGLTEQAHVSTLLSAISGAGVVPVAPCVYNFPFTTAAEMVAIASVLEAVGVAAYLGAAPLLSAPAILTAAGSILTVEARHQTLIRVLSKVAAVPNPFDTPLGVRAVFSLAAPFITSCPAGSNLVIQPFPAVTSTTAASAIVADARLSISSVAQGATHCAFVNGGVPGGAAFTPLEGGSCLVPQILSGEVYVFLSSAGPLTGVLTDEITVAGPMVVQIS